MSCSARAWKRRSSKGNASVSSTTSRVVQSSGQSLLELSACMARAKEQLMKHAMEQ